MTLYNSTTGATQTVQLPMPPAPAPLTYPTQISSKQIPVSEQGQSTLLWSDLDGMQTDPNVGAWIQANLFGCKLTPEYAPTAAPSVAAPSP